MKIALIDNDLLMRDNHNFPNLAVMKISAYHKSKGDNVELATFNDISPESLFKKDYDKIYISKAFTDTHTPNWVFTLNNVKTGGTGFYFDKAEPLPYEIEHIKPDYVAYKNAYHIIKNKKFYTDYSIGYTTRGCFRHCEFCINKNTNKVNIHSPIDEFYDQTRKKIALLDDNILGISNKYLFKIFDRLGEINKPFQYRQGMDIRLLNEERIDILLRLKYDGNYIFAFDKWNEKDLVEPKIKLFSEAMFNKFPQRSWIRTKFYVLCAFDYENKYDIAFWINDIIILFYRINIILKYKAMPYIMRFEKHKESPFYSLYMDAKEWCNSPSSFCYSVTFNEFLDKRKTESKNIRDRYPQFRTLFNTCLVK